MHAATKLIAEFLSPIYTKEEITGISRLIFEKVLGLSILQVHLNQKETIPAAKLTQIKEILNRLIRFEPIQYILGETEFYGTKLKVNNSVLIPRQETEELVEWIVHDHRNMTPHILDIGTGSGCIPIALLKNIHGATAEAWDISADALAIARENALTNGLKIDFQCQDILKPKTALPIRKFDVIVSNPPYVTPLDKTLMNKNVVDFEPHLALFVPDTDPLIFYKHIATLASGWLTVGGKIYFEINERYGDETAGVLESKGFKDVFLRKDINGKPRMIRATRVNS